MFGIEPTRERTAGRGSDGSGPGVLSEYLENFAVVYPVAAIFEDAHPELKTDPGPAPHAERPGKRQP